MSKLRDDVKLLFLDIETKPATAYVWKGFKENIGVDQIIDPGGILCVGAKWQNTDDVIFLSEWEDGQEQMLMQTQKLIEESDAIIGVNHERFDLPWLWGEFARHNIPAPPKPTLIDLQKYWRRGMRFFSNKLAFVGPHLVGSAKEEHEGFMLWRKVMEGDKDARKRMQSYCEQDVRLNEELYIKIKQYMPIHPYLGSTIKEERECPDCGSNHVHMSKNRRTKVYLIQQLHCQDCGRYFDGKRKKMV